jgi:hypothetical protein
MRINDTVRCLYGDGIIQGRTESGAALVRFQVEGVEKFRMVGGSWPLGSLFSTLRPGTNLVLMEIPIKFLRKV